MVTLLYVLHKNWIRKLKIHSYSNFSGPFHPNKRPSPCDCCHFIALFWMLFTKNERLNTWPSSYLNSTRIFLFVYIVKNHYTVNLVVILTVSKKNNCMWGITECEIESTELGLTGWWFWTRFLYSTTNSEVSEQEKEVIKNLNTTIL